MCYTIYLLHLAIAQGAMEFMISMRDKIHNEYLWFAGFTLVFFLSMAIAVPIFYLLFEKPCMDHSWPTRLKSFFLAKLRWVFRGPKARAAQTDGEETGNIKE